MEEEEEGCQSVGRGQGGGGVRAAAALHSAAGRHSVAILITQVGRASNSNKKNRTDDTAGPPCWTAFQTARLKS